MIKLAVYLMPPTVLRKNRKIMRDKSNCGVSRKNATRQIYEACSPDGWVLFVLWKHLTQLTIIQLYYKIVSVDIQLK